jgi:hypothetical protein
MAIINNSKKFIFVHVPKAAGTSITNELSAYTEYCDLEIGGTAFGEQLQPLYKRRFNLYKHISADEIKSIVGQHVWNEYFTFSIVRNPYTRLRSIFSFLKEWEGTPEDFKTSLSGFSGFNEFVESETWKTRLGPDRIFQPQGTWLQSEGLISVDYVGRLESIDEDFNKIIERIAPNSREGRSPINRLNRSSEASGRTLSADAINLINEYYHQDFADFGYEKISK